jgi:hypothetical protein
MGTAPLPPPMPPTNWFGRNWKWVVPVGCLVPVFFLGGCALAIFFFAMGVLKQTGCLQDGAGARASKSGGD